MSNLEGNRIPLSYQALKIFECLLEKVLSLYASCGPRNNDLKENKMYSLFFRPNYIEHVEQSEESKKNGWTNGCLCGRCEHVRAVERIQKQEREESLGSTGTGVYDVDE